MRCTKLLAVLFVTACTSSASRPMTVASAPPRSIEVVPIDDPAPPPLVEAVAAVAVAVAVAVAPRPATVDAHASGDRHTDFGINPWAETSRDPLSTFAADVDTAAYTYARRALTSGTLPAPTSVRVEEFVNYFSYRFPAPQGGSPFAVLMDAAPSPLDARHHVVRVGVATAAVANAARKPANLVFLVDVSGSMSSPDKLGLAQHALRILTKQLGPKDTVALVTYAGSTGIVLPATRGSEHRRILAAIDGLAAGGSTAMAWGIDLAYDQALKGAGPGIESRVIVLSDGDANVGSSNHQAMLKLIETRVAAGITLSTIGFGVGNYRDDLMEQLGDRGNGNNFYVDTAAAAERLFTTELVAMLEVAAKDVKLQVEFDRARVARYRLLGYENRDLRDQDFRVDAVDAGELGAGHQVTALYEVELTPAANQTTPLGAVRIRYKQPQGTVASELRFRMPAGPAATFDSAPSELRFAIAVAGFADLRRGAEDAQGWSLARIAEVARANAGADPDRRELVGLVERAAALRGSVVVAR